MVQSILQKRSLRISILLSNPVNMEVLRGGHARVMGALFLNSAQGLPLSAIFAGISRPTS